MRLAAATGFIFLMATAPAQAEGLKPGEYFLETNVVQPICLKEDGTWYGVNFNFGGHWQNNPANLQDMAAIYGNYAMDGHDYDGFGNDTITVTTFKKFPSAFWYDWLDDNSYAQGGGEVLFVFAKHQCDPPFTGENTHAANQSQNPVTVIGNVTASEAGSNDRIVRPGPLQLKPGQYSIPGGPTICLKGDLSWYGTTFNFGGTWYTGGGQGKDAAQIYGNYSVQGNEYQGFANTTLTVVKHAGGVLTTDWYDWYDGLAYENFETVNLSFVKSHCDKPNTQLNEHAASQ